MSLMSIPSQVALALLDGVADVKGKQYAIDLCDKAGKQARQAIDKILAEHGSESLYVMQVVGEVMIATVSDTVQKLFAAQKH